MFENVKQLGQFFRIQIYAINNVRERDYTSVDVSAVDHVGDLFQDFRTRVRIEFGGHLIGHHRDPVGHRRVGHKLLDAVHQTDYGVRSLFVDALHLVAFLLGRRLRRPQFLRVHHGFKRVPRRPHRLHAVLVFLIHVLQRRPEHVGHLFQVRIPGAGR